MLPRRTKSLVRSMFRVNHLFQLFLVLAGQATCRPTGKLAGLTSIIDMKEMHKDQYDFRETEVVYIAHNISSLHDNAIECCTLTFIPVSFPDGNPAVKVVKSCTLENATEDPGGSCGSSGTSEQNPHSASGTLVPGPMSTFTSQALTTSTDMSNTNSPASSSLSITSLFTSSTAASEPTVTLLSSSIPSSPLTSTTLTLSPSSSLLSLSSSQLDSATSTVSPTDVSTSTFTFSSTDTTGTSTANIATSFPPKHSSTLPKLIGAFAGVAVLLLIIAGTVGYLKQKKMAKDESHEIPWQ